MEAIKFTISGKSAFFKNPVYAGITGQGGEQQFFSFNNIHKINILGILGATIGLSGYARGEQNTKLPDFYQQLKDLEISIVPNTQTGFFTTTRVKCNNSSKLISKTEKKFSNSNKFINVGITFNYVQNWLVNPSWNVYIKHSNNKHYEMIKDYLMNEKTEYIRYLGSMSHIAKIENVEIVELTYIENFNGKIHSLFSTEEKLQCNKLLLEKYPIALNKETFYTYQTLLFTTKNVQVNNIFQTSNGQNIYFLKGEEIDSIEDNVDKDTNNKPVGTKKLLPKVSKSFS